MQLPFLRPDWTMKRQKISNEEYVLYMPNKEQLIAQVEAVLEKRKENGNES